MFNVIDKIVQPRAQASLPSDAEVAKVVEAYRHKGADILQQR